MPVAHGGNCRHCIESAPPFTFIRTPYVMDAGARRLAHLLKYDGLTSLSEPMAELLAERDEWFAGRDVVVPVPLHGRRERARGYNQAAELAKHVAARRAFPIDARAAVRVRDTAPLVKAMSRDERRRIMEAAFAGRRERVEGARVLLVDDVVTTGATLSACAEALLHAGAASVGCVTWARAD
jgi:ComF family protein